jgi:Lipase (class 3)
MDFSVPKRKRCTALAAALAALMALSGCGAAVTFYASRPSNDGTNDTAEFKPESDQFLVDMAQRFGLMALFAEAVYRRDLPRAARDKDGCAYLAAAATGAAAPTYGMPQTATGRWRRWAPTPQAGVVPCLDDESGLHYETYVYERTPGQIEEAVIAFRGTENRPGQLFNDWRSNVAAFFGFEPTQYAVARQRMLPLIEALKQVLAHQGPAPRIFVTGHSLGGGLAQQTGYLSKAVKEVYTFNTTPVTNWSKLRLLEQVKNANPIFHRVYHGGEFLEKVRFVSTSATQARFGRHDIGLQLKGRSSFAGHSIQIMACSFAELLKNAVPPAHAPPHPYPVEYIRDTLLNEQRTDQPCAKAMAGA